MTGPFFPANIEVRWLHDGLLQYWRPGDRDYRNLGGTVRSLDRFGSILTIKGVHPADMESPDAKALTWLAWLQCEDDPWYYEKSPEKRPGMNGDFFTSIRYNLRQILQRTHNHTLDHLLYAPGVLSRSGYFFLNDSLSPLMDADDFPVERNRPGYQDWYFFAYGSDYRAALRDFILLSGRPSLPTRNTFGLMFCRWPAPDEKEARQIVEEFHAHGVPLAALIIDMEWHKEGWGHWEWDPQFYADPAGFFRWCHKQGLEVALNDHPLDVRADDMHFNAYLAQAGTANRVRRAKYNGREVDMIDVNICDKREAAAFLEVCHKHIVDIGLDFWWNDGCRGKINGAVNQLVCNKLCFEEVQKGDRRGMLLARYGGLGSHRYGVFFTGDTLSCWEVLQTQCEFNIRAGHIGMAYVSHDIGGFFMHCGAPLLDPALYLRWLQFGVFSPVFRFHSAPGSGSRKPWDYGERISKIALRWLRVRNSLIPYIYTAAREHWDTGVPLVRGVFFDRPGDEAAYRYDEYMFGPSILAAPVLSAQHYRQVYLPEGDWYLFETAERITGGRELTIHMGLEGIPVYVKEGAVLVRQDPDTAPGKGPVERLLLDIYPGEAGAACLYEDDGCSRGFERGDYCRTCFEVRQDSDSMTLTANVVAGKPFIATREVEVLLSSRTKPAAAQFEGRTVAVSEVSNGRWRLCLGRIDAVRRWRLTVILGKEGGQCQHHGF